MCMPITNDSTEPPMKKLELNKETLTNLDLGALASVDGGRPNTWAPGCLTYTIFYGGCRTYFCAE